MKSKSTLNASNTVDFPFPVTMSKYRTRNVDPISRHTTFIVELENPEKRLHRRGGIKLDIKSTSMALFHNRAFALTIYFSCLD